MICSYCEVELVTASGLIQHHELASYPDAETDRGILFFVVQDEDPKRLISKSTSDGVPMAGLGWLFKATEESWNGEARECDGCPRTFRTMKQLNQHCASPARKCEALHFVVLGTGICLLCENNRKRRTKDQVEFPYSRWLSLSLSN